MSQVAWFFFLTDGLAIQSLHIHIANRLSMLNLLRIQNNEISWSSLALHKVNYIPKLNIAPLHFLIYLFSSIHCSSSFIYSWIRGYFSFADQNFLRNSRQKQACQLRPINCNRIWWVWWEYIDSNECYYKSQWSRIGKCIQDGDKNC